MPRSAFVADLQEVIAAGIRKPSITKLRAGEEDGSILFDYVVPDGNTTKITILVPEPSEYPDSHSYMIFTDSEQVPQKIHETLDSMDSHQGMRVARLLGLVARQLDQATLPPPGSRANPVDLDQDVHISLDSEDESDLSTTSSSASPASIISARRSLVSMSSSESESADEEDSDDEENFNDGEDSNDDEASVSDSVVWSPSSPKRGMSHPPSWSSRPVKKPRLSAINHRMQADLSLARDAGFRVSVQGDLLEGAREGFVSLSIRVNKLGISEEALQAWDMHAAQYFILFIRYLDEYQPLETITDPTTPNAHNLIAFRVGLCDKYKVGIREFTKVFSATKNQRKSTSKVAGIDDHSTPVPKLGRLFIARPLEELLNDRLLPLIRTRIAMSCPWGGAEEFFNDHQGRSTTDHKVDRKYWAEDQSSKASLLPSVAVEDHLNDTKKEKSLPLVAMQFVLRHLVRCTEFCLVCHRRIGADFEALKPYVCANPLCLYQYMGLGFGPSIEHEIISQPLVVDLLVSFCYASARAGRLGDLPEGMALMVPAPSDMHTLESWPGASSYEAANHSPWPALSTGTARSKPRAGKIYNATLIPSSQEILLDPDQKQLLKVGSWIMYSPLGSRSEVYHARVESVMFPMVELGRYITDAGNTVNSLFGPNPPTQQNPTKGSAATNPADLTPAATPPANTPAILPSRTQKISFAIYSTNLDDLHDHEKCWMICKMLDTLPSIPDLRSHLLAQGGSDVPSLRTWNQRLSPAALGILRWIIASNTAYIVQVDRNEASQRNSEERVSGMPGWTQFRFAQGAPDKEQRFIQSIRQTTSTSQHPTLFAWHGSPLENWHSIVRKGLHFEQTAHGRAFGNGVYHSLSVFTSLNYSGGLARPSPDQYANGSNKKAWPSSQLQISQALTLNEIVNAPDQFKCKNPHLVVPQLDWIQSRYLFVMCSNRFNEAKEVDPTSILDQDPVYVPRGQSDRPLVIPLNAISKSRKIKTEAPAPAHGDKERDSNDDPSEDPAFLSDETETEDRLILLPPKDKDGKQMTQLSEGEKAHPTISTPLTTFQPGTYNRSSLPLLLPPSYATPLATRTLQRELNTTLRTLKARPPQELGWHIDQELLTNMYQWIIELHSFEPELPLAQDLLEKSLQSVLLEIRFGKDYPMTPPFVRIIRPRFLSFTAGGGGHVTAGGALCMELLTNSGWSAANSLESVLLQVRLALSSTDPKPARLEAGPVRDYGAGEAKEAFLRACRTHGWQVPPDFAASYGQN